MTILSFNKTPDLKMIPKNLYRDNKRNVILTIFAGRRYYLEILFKYLDVLINHDKLHEVHLWNYTRSNTDNIWLKSLNKKKYNIYEPKNKKGCWEEYYDYYCNQAKYKDDDIIIKCDDDIVFIDIEFFDDFINQIDDKHIYFPNIVNNDVCAYIQSKNNIHQLLKRIKHTRRGDTSTLTNWYTSYEKAKLIHTHFLTNNKNYRISGPNIIWNSRISINFYGSEFSYIKKIYRLFVNRKNRISDEDFFAYICKDNQFNHIIVPKFVVSHFSFGPQNSLRLANEFLINYYMLADTYTQLNATTKQRTIAIYGAWCDSRNELWIKKKLNGKGVDCKSITILHSYNNKIIEIPGLDFPGENITSMKCANLPEARLKYKNYIYSDVL